MAQKSSLGDLLKKNILIFDGAMGTELYRNHIFTNECYDNQNLSKPDLVRSIHRSYLQAGADILTTNTFGANRPNLERYGLGEKTVAINRAGAALAREIADEKSDRRILVAGSVGPLAPNELVHLALEKQIKILAEQIDALITGQVDFIFFETLPSRSGILLAAEAMKMFSRFPFVLSAAVTNGVETACGERVSRLFAPLPDGVPMPEAWGLNCGLGPDGMIDPIQEAMPVISLPLIVQPNAGAPKEFEGRQLYYCSPEYIATYAMRYVQLGVAGIGGCCGTTPEHIAEIVQMVKPLAEGRAATRMVLNPPAPEAVPVPASPFASRSALAKKLSEKQWVQTVEMTPPRGYDLTDILAKAKKLGDNGVDAINLPDGPRASSRIASLAVAEQILSKTGVEPILHFCCRDKNLIGMQADLLACAAYNIRNILFITGDPPKLGIYPNATGVFDTDSIGMSRVQKRLNQGIDLGGQAIQPATNAVIGVGLDPTALDGKRERQRFLQKVDAGAEFAITQPVFDTDTLLRFLDKLGDLPIPIIAGVWPLTSMRNANFMQNEVPGVTVPESVMNRMEAVSHQSNEDQIRTGIEIAREIIGRIRDTVAGVQVSAPFGKIDISLAVLK